MPIVLMITYNKSSTTIERGKIFITKFEKIENAMIKESENLATSQEIDHERVTQLLISF